MPSGDIAADTAAIISLALEWGLYGMSVILFGSTMITLLFEPATVNHKMVAITMLFFLLSTAHAIVDVVRMNAGFIVDRNTFPGGPANFFGDATQQFFLIRSSIYVIQTLVADGVVIYRCYAVWRTWKIIVFPIVLWCSVLASGAGALNSLAAAGRSGGGAQIFVFSKWINSFFGSSLGTNLISTALLAYRIWHINKGTAHHRVDIGGGNPLRAVLRVIIDAGILYSVTLVVALITFVTGSNSQYIVLDVLMPIMSIAFYMIIVRVSRARKQHSGATSSRSKGTVNHNQTQAYPLRPVQIRITQLSERDADIENQLGGGVNSESDDDTKNAAP